MYATTTADASLSAENVTFRTNDILVSRVLVYHLHASSLKFFSQVATLITWNWLCRTPSRSVRTTNLGTYVRTQIQIRISYTPARILKVCTSLERFRIKLYAYIRITGVTVY